MWVLITATAFPDTPVDTANGEACARRQHVQRIVFVSRTLMVRSVSVILDSWATLRTALSITAPVILAPTAERAPVTRMDITVLVHLNGKVNGK